jgi:hypothetical protein
MLKADLPKKRTEQLELPSQLLVCASPSPELGLPVSLASSCELLISGFLFVVVRIELRALYLLGKHLLLELVPLVLSLFSLFFR